MGATWIKDVEGRYVYANDYAQRIFRTSKCELQGRTDEQIFSPETARQFRENDLRVIEIRCGIQTFEELQHEDGVHTSVVSKFPILDAEGRVRYVGGMAIDITEQRRIEEALRQGEVRLRLALEAGRMGTWDWNILTGELKWSENLMALHGVTAETFEGTLEAFERLVHPDDRDLLQTAISRAIEQRSPYDAEFRIVRPDGSIHWMSGRGTAFYDERGTPTHMVGIGMDITERREAAERLRESEERFRALMEQAPFSVQVFTPDGRTARVNRAWERLWGVSVDQIGDYNILEDRQLEARGVLSHIERAFAGEPVQIPAIEYDPNETIPDISRHASPRWTSAVAYPLRDATGQVRQVVLIHEDITAQKRAEEALRESEERFRSLAEGMPHCVWVCDA